MVEFKIGDEILTDTKFVPVHDGRRGRVIKVHRPVMCDETEPYELLYEVNLNGFRGSLYFKSNELRSPVCPLVDWLNS